MTSWRLQSWQDGYCAFLIKTLHRRQARRRAGCQGSASVPRLQSEGNRCLCAVCLEFGGGFEFGAVISDRLTWGTFFSSLQNQLSVSYLSLLITFKIPNLLVLSNFFTYVCDGLNGYKSPRN